MPPMRPQHKPASRSMERQGVFRPAFSITHERCVRNERAFRAEK